ncbi:OLC1v1023630C1 [Oldenlandia corymbosa var. corymbosa]|uniref:OLC1v1023630C1 n=1 Tax=Oldenlandia corymbosa var. corymbosa TaxID=529605 RepID=A0AAV1C0V6_OLDCO|nr:OLC1v1023630C1 [Oldenlandia corymbosa var. corymbosa]
MLESSLPDLTKMEFLYNLFAILPAIVLVSFGWRILNWVWFKPKKLEKQLKKQGLKGTPYKFLFGDIKEILKMDAEAKKKPINFTDDIIPRVMPFIHKAINENGENSYIWTGPRPSLLLMEPDLVKEVLNKSYLFQKPPSNPLTKLLAEGLASYETDKWAKHRKLINPAFQLERVKLMVILEPTFYTSCCGMLNKWEKMTPVETEGSFELDVWPDLQVLTSDVISRTAFSSNYEEGRRIFELQKEQADLILQVARSIYIPGWRFLPTKRNNRMKQIAKEVDNSIAEIINARLKPMQAEGKYYGEDLLGLLLESNSQENGNHGIGRSKLAMTIKDVIEECKLFYFAGQETTSVLLVWTMILLSRFQDWQSRAREEVLRIFGTNKPDFDGLNHLKVVNMILHEVLRLYPPIATISRKTAEETTVGNITLPAGVVVTMPIMLIHHDPKIWGDDVKEFKPERFAEGVSHATKGQVVFFPFGWGPRICIGQNFAMLEAKLAMAMILQRFSFELSSSYSHAPRSLVTLQPQHGAHLILRKF